MKKNKTKTPEEEMLRAERQAAPEAEEQAAPETPEKAAPEAEEQAPEAEEQAPDAADEDALREDVELFHSLFPEVGAKDVPREVWDKVEKGQSLAASYALYVLMKEKEDERIRKVNEENAASAPPRIRHDGADGSFYSPEAVKKMSQAEVRKNYKDILRSMDQWN